MNRYTKHLLLEREAYGSISSLHSGARRHSKASKS